MPARVLGPLLLVLALWSPSCVSEQPLCVLLLPPVRRRPSSEARVDSGPGDAALWLRTLTLFS